MLDVRDVTVEKQAELALRESEEQLRVAAELKDEFLGLVSHELRTPISTILGNGLLLVRQWAMIPQDDRQQALSDIASEAEKLQEIIENLLLITRMEAGSLDSDPLAMERLIEESIEDFRRMHPDRLLSFAPSAGLPPALGEPTLVPLIMRNLLSNADKYSPADKPIEVSLRFDQESDSLEVAVRDYGIGLDTSTSRPCSSRSSARRALASTPKAWASGWRCASGLRKRRAAASGSSRSRTPAYVSSFN